MSVNVYEVCGIKYRPIQYKINTIQNIYIPDESNYVDTIFY
jgi:hypothetical protein